MSKRREYWTDHKVETLMGNLLRAGVVISALVILIGAVLYLHLQGFATPHYSTFAGEPTELRKPSEIVRGVLQLNGEAIIQFGVLLLIATPIARVVFCVIAFAAQRDHLYVLVSFLVLAILMFSITGARL